MPRQLVASNDWRPLRIPYGDVRRGDLLFVKNKEKEKVVSHVALILEIDRIFHCCLAKGTAVIESPEVFFEQYEQPWNFGKMIRYIDPRNREERKKNQGIYIKFSEV